MNENTWQLQMNDLGFSFMSCSEIMEAAWKYARFYDGNIGTVLQMILDVVKQENWERERILKAIHINDQKPHSWVIKQLGVYGYVVYHARHYGKQLPNKNRVYFGKGSLLGYEMEDGYIVNLHIVNWYMGKMIKLMGIEKCEFIFE